MRWWRAWRTRRRLDRMASQLADEMLLSPRFVGDLLRMSKIPRFNTGGVASFEIMGIGATVIDSPNGPGTIEKFSRDGLPYVAGEVASWCVFAYGQSLRVFDPMKQAPDEYRRA